MKRAGLFLVLLLAAVYGGDYLSVVFRIPGNRDPFGSVKIKRYISVQLKGNKTEFYPADPEVQQCVYSLFPHFGDSPCWYVTRHTVKHIEM
jgi:hypothetical protein